MTGSAPPPAGLDDVTRGRIAAAWAFRAASEQEAEGRSLRLAAELAETGAAPVVVAMGARAAEDERRHARLCADVAARYGAPPPPRDRVEARPIGPPHYALRDRVLYEVVSFCCINETINASLLARTLEVARDGVIRDAVRRILKDEVDHGRLGWAHLAEQRARGAGAFLGAALPRMLDAAVSDELFLPDDRPPGAGGVAHGDLPRATLLAILRETLDGVILPGFDRFGVDTRAARGWLAARAPLEGPA